MKQNRLTKEYIRDYWNKRLPQRWYSNKEYGTLPYWNEVSEKRYTIYYPYLKWEAEFYEHKGEKILEIGVGVGTDTLEYGKGGAEVTGIDLTENAINITSERFIKNGLAGTFLVSDVENLPFENNTFDLVFCFGVLHHTPNIDKSLYEIQRVLKPSGKAIIMLYANGWKHYIIRLFYHGILKGELLRMNKQEVINKNSEVEGNSPLTKVYSKGQIYELFKKWDHIELRRYRMGGFFDYPHYGMRMLPWPIRWMAKKFKLEKVFGENWLIKAYK
jgi:ubiquinone/menaquinone biosynthesis C-methylase UbiE